MLLIFYFFVCVRGFRCYVLDRVCIVDFKGFGKGRVVSVWLRGFVFLKGIVGNFCYLF